MSGYNGVPDDALIRMALHSEKQVDFWETAKREAAEAIERAERMVCHWTSERDGQYAELDQRDIPAPTGRLLDSGHVLDRDAICILCGRGITASEIVNGRQQCRGSRS